jgi:hypothetical protein
VSTEWVDAVEQVLFIFYFETFRFILTWKPTKFW